MFGVDFSELALIFIVALVVLGPTRLPGLVRKVGRWVGKARGMARDFQQQLENEINIDELNRSAKKTVEEAFDLTPVPPPEFSGDPPKADAAPESEADKLAQSGYPYGAASAPETPAATEPAVPQPGDDTYSHAHAHGDAPMSDEPAGTDAAGTDGNPGLKKDTAAA